MHAHKIKITPGILSVFSPETRYFFGGKLRKGSLEGNIEIGDAEGSRRFVVKASGTELQIDDLPFAKHLFALDQTGYNITGMVSGNFTFQTDEAARIDFKASNFKIELATPLLNQDSYSFQTIDGVMSIQDNRIEIKNCTLKGVQMNATFSGTIGLRDPVSKSRLEIAGALIPHHAFLAGLKGRAGMDTFPQKSRGAEGYGFRIEGTTARPEFRFN
jgi:type II secretion system protein N